jgi:hypothetical protein
MKPFKIDHKLLVKGRTCIHVNGDRSICCAKVPNDMPHGWLCDYHDALVRKVKLVVKEG